MTAYNYNSYWQDSTKETAKPTNRTLPKDDILRKKWEKKRYLLDQFQFLCNISVLTRKM